MAPQGAAYFVDWIWSNNSNVHVANHRDWFTTFTEFKSQTDSAWGGSLEVLGVGDVELEVKTHLNRKGSKSHRTVVLKDVLYAPKAVCNILGSPILEDYGVVTGGEHGDGGLKDPKTGGSAGLFDKVKLWKLLLVGHQKGRTSLDLNSHYWISARWTEAERARWFLYKKLVLATPADEFGEFQPSRGITVLRDAKMLNHTRETEDDYTPAEKEWLKTHYGNEFKFLQSYGLKIYKGEEREEGRSILRALMHDDDEEEDDEDEEEEDDFLADLEADPASHVADYHFSEEQLDWVKKHYRHSGNFLTVHGLKPWDDGDCREGVQIARGFMADSD